MLNADTDGEAIYLPAYRLPDGSPRDYPSYTQVTAPGCYAWQIDGESFSYRIFFTAQIPS